MDDLNDEKPILGGMHVCRPAVYRGEPPFGLRLMSDLHIGAPQTDYKMIQAELEEAAEKGDRVLINGDLLDLILPKDNKRYTPEAVHPRIAKTSHPVNAAVDWAVELLAPVAHQIDMIGVGNHECFDAETEVLTSQGWLPFPELTPEHQVASYQVDTGEIEFHVPLKTHRYHYEGEMVTLRNRHTDLCVTPNHRILWKNGSKEEPLSDGWTFVEAGDLPRADIVLPCAGMMSAPGAPFTDDEIRAVAWLLKSHEVNSALDTCSWNYSKREHRCNTQTICIRKVVKQSLPYWLWDCTKEQFDVFLSTYINGHGTQHRPGITRTETIFGRKHFLDDLQALCVLFGYRTVLSKAEGRKNDWRLYVNPARTTSLSVGKVGRSPYVGFVYCVTTKNGTVVVRRNGRVTVTGNSAVQKWNGVDPTLLILYRLEEITRQRDPKHIIHYGGYTGFVDYRLNSRKEGRGNFRWVLYYHHGSGASAPVTRGTIDFARKDVFIDADFLWLGHKHQSLSIKAERLRCPMAGNDVEIRPIRHVMTGAYFRTYVGQSQASVRKHGRRSNYAADAGLAPGGRGGARVELTWTQNRIAPQVRVTH